MFPKAPSRARTVAGFCMALAVSALLLAWALHDVDLSTMLRRVAAVDRGGLIASILSFLAAMVLRGLRWRALLAGRESVPPRAAIQATFFGAAANNLLPARAGELVRALQLSRVTDVGSATALGSIALLRAIDVLALLGLLFTGLLLDGPHGSNRIAFTLPGQTQWIAAGVVLLAVSILVLGPKLKAPLLWAIDRAGQSLPSRHRDKILVTFERFLSGLSLLDSPRKTVQLAIWTAAIWAAHSMALVLAMQAFSLGAPWSSVFLIQFLIGFAIALPSAPGFFGTFEAAGRLALAAYGIGATEAVTFTLAFHILVAIVPTLGAALVLAALPAHRSPDSY